MRPVWGKRAERKSLFFVTVIFVLAVIGACMSTGNYHSGREAVTANAVKILPQINTGFFGLLLAFIALVALLSLGYFALSSGKARSAVLVAGPISAAAGVETIQPIAAKTGIVELDRVDREIADLSRRLNEIDSSFGK
ncbi:MAG: hypothetical protein KJ574_04485 [Nanoarchaeota archaeon]|nr:hypothetical protein [Nanoarchaeota archaeon]